METLHKPLPHVGSLLGCVYVVVGVVGLFVSVGLAVHFFFQKPVVQPKVEESEVQGIFYVTEGGEATASKPTQGIFIGDTKNVVEVRNNTFLGGPTKVVLFSYRGGKDKYVYHTRKALTQSGRQKDCAWSLLGSDTVTDVGKLICDRVQVIEGVTDSSVSQYGLRVEKAELFTWDEIHPAVMKVLSEVLQEEQPSEQP